MRLGEDYRERPQVVAAGRKSGPFEPVGHRNLHRRSKGSSPLCTCRNTPPAAPRNRTPTRSETSPGQFDPFSQGDFLLAVSKESPHLSQIHPNRIIGPRSKITLAGQLIGVFIVDILGVQIGVVRQIIIGSSVSSTLSTKIDILLIHIMDDNFRQFVQQCLRRTMQT